MTAPAKVRTVKEVRMEPVTLRALTEVRELIDAMLDASEGELTSEIADALDSWNVEFDAKVERVAMAVQRYEREADDAKEEARAYTARATAKSRRAESLKTYLYDCLRSAGKTKVEGVYKTVAIQANNPSVVTKVELDDSVLREIAQLAPFAIRHVPESFVLDKKAILDQYRVAGLHERLAQFVDVVKIDSLRIR